jgi:hypothetical protein
MVPSNLVVLLPLVHLISLVEGRPRACSFENAEVELASLGEETRARRASS